MHHNLQRAGFLFVSLLLAAACTGARAQAGDSLIFKFPAYVSSNAEDVFNLPPGQESAILFFRTLFRTSDVPGNAQGGFYVFEDPGQPASISDILGVRALPTGIPGISEVQLTLLSGDPSAAVSTAELASGNLLGTFVETGQPQPVFSIKDAQGGGYSVALQSDESDPAVPEPGALPLLTAGLLPLGLGLFRKRRRDRPAGPAFRDGTMGAAWTMPAAAGSGTARK